MYYGVSAQALKGVMVSPTVAAILFGIVWIVLGATLPVTRRGSMRSLILTTAAGVAIIAALDWFGLFPMPPYGAPTELIVPLAVLMPVALVIAVIVIRRRQRA